MKNIYLNGEWTFIKDEIRKEKATKNNILKRELLFILQILLSSGFNNQRSKRRYIKIKNKYLNF